MPAAEQDLDGEQVNDAFAQLAVIGDEDRHELLITHNFVIGWFVRHALDAHA